MMAQQSERPRPHGDPLDDAVVDNGEDNRAQRDSDATADATVDENSDRLNNSDRADGRGSDANGVPAFDDADDQRRRKLYDEGADLVSRID
jgi:hypothetical protein